ncbi:MAG: 3-oxoacyl-[acyl-carrier-protein] synthase II [Polaribacter sp.]|jgi:3-oxoacyl-[acyl-carrier-protein] synthase II
MNNSNRVVITGIGILSPFGIGRDLFWDQLHKGCSAAKEINTFDASTMPTRFWANAPQGNEALNEFIVPRKSSKLLTRAGRMALIAAEEAVQQSGIEFSSINHSRVGVSVGTGGIGLISGDLPKTMVSKVQGHNIGSLTYEEEGIYWKELFDSTSPLLSLLAIPNSISAHLSIRYKAQANCQTITTACTSSSQAIGEAFHKIKFGLSDVMIAGGSDSMTDPNSLLSFGLLGVLSTNNANFKSASKPFDRDRDGFLLGEGAAFFILENLSHCEKRGGTPLAEITGYGTASDAYRLTDEPDDGHGSIAAMQAALNEAQLNPENISYINAHGTSTTMNDRIETFAIKKVFGDQSYKVPVSSNKSMIGHLVAGAGAIELGASVLSMQNQVIPPTINLENPDPNCDLDYVPNTARDANLNAILSNSFGFGGQNSCLIIEAI